LSRRETEGGVDAVSPRCCKRKGFDRHLPSRPFPLCSLCSHPSQTSQSRIFVKLPLVADRVPLYAPVGALSALFHDFGVFEEIDPVAGRELGLYGDGFRGELGEFLVHRFVIPDEQVGLAVFAFDPDRKSHADALFRTIGVFCPRGAVVEIAGHVDDFSFDGDLFVVVRRDGCCTKEEGSGECGKGSEAMGGRAEDIHGTVSV